MSTFKLLNKKRGPYKRLAFYGLLSGILLLFIIALSGKKIDDSIKAVIMLVSALAFIVSIFILGHSIKFKSIIGTISFLEDNIKIEILNKEEIIPYSNIEHIRFKLSGYEGVNSSTLFENILFFPSLFAYHSGMRNFVYIHTTKGIRIFEVFLQSKKEWVSIKRIAQSNFVLFESKRFNNDHHDKN